MLRDLGDRDALGALAAAARSRSPTAWRTAPRRAARPPHTDVAPVWPVSTVTMRDAAASVASTMPTMTPVTPVARRCRRRLRCHSHHASVAAKRIHAIATQPVAELLRAGPATPTRAASASPESFAASEPTAAMPSTATTGHASCARQRGTTSSEQHRQRAEREQHDGHVHRERVQGQAEREVEGAARGRGRKHAPTVLAAGFALVRAPGTMVPAPRVAPSRPNPPGRRRSKGNRALAGARGVPHRPAGPMSRPVCGSGHRRGRREVAWIAWSLPSTVAIDRSRSPS